MLNASRHEAYLKILLKIRSITLRITIGFGLKDFDVFRYKVLILLLTKQYTYQNTKTKLSPGLHNSNAPVL